MTGIPPQGSNPLLLPETIANTVRYADWKGAAKRGGPAGLTAEMLRSLAGTNTEPFFVPADGGWTPDEIARLLMQYGVRLWGLGHFNNEIFFRVKKRQSHWAQYVLLRAGVPLEHGLLDGSRAIPGAGQAKAPSSRGTLDRIIDWLSGLL